MQQEKLELEVVKVLKKQLINETNKNEYLEMQQGKPTCRRCGGGLFWLFRSGASGGCRIGWSSCWS